MPWLFGDDSEIKAYISNQQAIMENQRRIMYALGVQLAWPENNAATSATSTSWGASLRTRFTSFLAGRSPARGAAVRGMSYIISSNITNRRMRTMKKWFRPDAISVIGGVAAVALARFLGTEIDPANIVAIIIILLGYFKADEYVTIVRDANGLPMSFRVNSRKFIFTAVAFGLILADIALNLNLSNELIFTITAAVTGYNFAEGKKDAKEAEHEVEEARQTH
jgi:hypothetical protein